MKVNLNNPDLWIVNIPFLNPVDAQNFADKLTGEGFALVRVEHTDGKTYEWRHGEQKDLRK